MEVMLKCALLIHRVWSVKMERKHILDREPGVNRGPEK